MFSRATLAAIVLTFITGNPTSSMARGVDLAHLDLALQLLPSVEEYELDDKGHLTGLAGELSPPGPHSPAEVAVGFLRIHADLYPRAENSAFELESVIRTTDGTRVVVRQLVGGFELLDHRLEFEFSSGGILTRISGVVLHAGELPDQPLETLSENDAIRRARGFVHRRDDPVASGARRVLFGIDHSRSWMVDFFFEDDLRFRNYTVVIDAYEGELREISVGEVELDSVELFLETSPPGGASHPTSCAPVVPPVGDYETASGHLLWEVSSVGCELWELDPGVGASLFRGNCLEYDCEDFPSTSSCNHGEIRRPGLELGPGYERVRIRVRDPDQELFMRFRWGLDGSRAAPFLVGSGLGGTTEVELDLSKYPSWESQTVSAITMEMVDDRSVWLERLDLWPGPWLEFAGGPTIDGPQGGSGPVAGEPITVSQDVRNLACSTDAGADSEMRILDYLLYRIVGPSRHFEGVACDDVEIVGEIPPESTVHGMPMCDFVAPEAGTWELEADFVHHPESPVATRFTVQAPPAPNLAVNLSLPIDLYSGPLALWPCREDVLDIQRFDDPNPPCALPYIVAFEARASGLEEPVTSAIRVWGRPGEPGHDPGSCDPLSAGWMSVAPPRSWVFEQGHQGPVDLPLDEAMVRAIPLPVGGWTLLDLKVVIDPVADELELDDNIVCLASWIPVSDGAIGPTVGQAWVDDDYFLEPEHWPPVGLTWTGLSVVHEEGASGYEPHSALAVLTVDDGANEEPRLVWYEERPDESVSGLMLRYRRRTAGFGGEAFLDAGAAEAAGLPVFDLDGDGHPNRNRLVADNQWRTLVWRRGAGDPFGSYPVPIMISPGTTGDTLSLHLSVDTNCEYEEPDCVSGVYPETMVDSLRAWAAPGPPSAEPLFTVAGLRFLDAGVWRPLPPQLAVGAAHQLAVEVRNLGTADGEAHLTTAIEVTDLDESPGSLTLAGSAVVTIPAGSAYHLQLQPAWQPASTGRRLLAGQVLESGEVIGGVSETVEVVGGAGDCPIPIVDLP